MEEARKWQEATAGKKYSIPVYEPDGKTVIGEFNAASGGPIAQ